MAEKRSWVLCHLIGHEVTWKEVVNIAKKATQGRVAFYDIHGKRISDADVSHQ
jgi:hypothetical protein